MTETTPKTRKFQVEIEETLRRVVTVEVPDTPDAEWKALSKVQIEYWNEEIVLSADDHVHTTIQLATDTTKTK